MCTLIEQNLVRKDLLPKKSYWLLGTLMPKDDEYTPVKAAKKIIITGVGEGRKKKKTQ
jgi:hypothetical protein